MAELVEFTPANGLEETIASGRSGAMPMEVIIGELERADLFVSSTREVLADGSGFEPLLLGEPLAPLVAIFTAPERPFIHRARAEYMIQMKGRELFVRMPPGYGLVVNPGYATQLIISSDALADIKDASSRDQGRPAA